MQLTKTLLDLDFGLQIDLPSDRLCPPVANRHNYILWLKSLLDSSAYDDVSQKLTGLDIGTGASCIYPLLGCRQRDWSFVGTDIDSKSLEYAKRNVQLNDLSGRIQLVARKPGDPMIPTDQVAARIDFTMSNPPFYESQEDLDQSAKEKSWPPLSACTGAPVEMVTTGGEVAFVARILDESLTHRDKIQWYTSMLGKQSSVEILVEKLRYHGISNFAVTEFIQGNKTKRWAIGWGFGGMRPSTAAARGVHGDKWKKLLPPIVDADIVHLPLDAGVGATEGKIHSLMSSLELESWTWDKERLRGIGRARENVWSRAWRRRKAREAKEGVALSTSQSKSVHLYEFGFEINVSVGTNGMAVACTWREGDDPVIFESFCGFLKTQLKGGTVTSKPIQPLSK